MIRVICDTKHKEQQDATGRIHEAGEIPRDVCEECRWNYFSDIENTSPVPSFTFTSLADLVRNP